MRTVSSKRRATRSVAFFALAVLVTLAISSLVACQGKKPAGLGGEYRNILAEIGVSQADIDARVEKTVEQFFRGNNAQRIYYEFGDGMAYILDVGNRDVRSEGMSYGMMFCVQLGMKEEFDRLWKYSHEILLHKTGDYAGYFAWHAAPDGTIIDKNPAPDGEEYFAMSLLMASNRWGDGEGIFDYRARANDILDHMLNHRKILGLPPKSWIGDMFDANRNQVVFVPFGGSATFSDPSYHLPHFYELFALWADKDNDRWRAIAAESRAFFRKACHPKTGLAPDYADFDGVPVKQGDHYRFEYDAWRVAMNIALDSAWWGKDPWQREEWAPTYLSFFSKLGVSMHPDQFDVDGGNPAGSHSTGLVAMNAVAGLIVPTKVARPFVEEFWLSPIPSGRGRYFDGCLYRFALLNLSGRYRSIGPSQ